MFSLLTRRANRNRVLPLGVKPGPSRAGLLIQTLRISIPLSLGVAVAALPV
jgi:hypothetical protein